MAQPTYAQTTATDSDASNDVTVLQPLEIIGSNAESAETGDVVDDEFTGSRGRIERILIRQSGIQLGEILSTISGVQQRQSGGFGTFSSITIRAASAAQTSVYLDGVLLNSGGESVIDLSTLEVLNLDSIDIYKGSTPLQLGQAGMGGAINLSSLSHENKPITRLRLGLGSFSHKTLQGAYQATKGHWSWTASGTYQSSDNDFGFLSNNSTPLNPNDDTNQRRHNNQVTRTSVLAKATFRPSSDSRSELLLQATKREAGVPNVINSIGNQARYDTFKTQLQFSQIINGWRGWNTRHSLYVHVGDNLYDDSRSQVGLGAQFIETDLMTLGSKTYWERFFDLGTLGVSIDLRDESLSLTDQSSIGEDVAAEQQLLFATLHASLFDANERWVVTPAIRLQATRRTEKSNASGQFETQPAESEIAPGLQLGAAYNITPKLVLSANAGNYFREPSFRELYGSIGLINGNPELLAESGTNLDIGLQYELDNARFDATVFRSFRDELILTTFDARGIGRPSNTGEALITGIELSTSWNPVDNVALSGNLTIQNPRNRNRFVGFRNKQLPGEAKNSYFARAQYKPAKIAYWYEWQSVRNRFYDSANLLPAKNTSLHSIGLDVENEKWNFSARIQNLTDDIVEDFNGFPKPGRVASIAITRTL